MGDPDDLYIEKSKVKLTMYNGAVMYPVGKCKLKCTRDGSSHVLEFQVVDGDVRPLLSTESCQRLNVLKVPVHTYIMRVLRQIYDNKQSFFQKKLGSYSRLVSFEKSFVCYHKFLSEPSLYMCVVVFE